MTAQRYVVPVTEFRNADLHDARFDHVDLAGASFRDVNLTGARSAPSASSTPSSATWAFTA